MSDELFNKLFNIPPNGLERLLASKTSPTPKLTPAQQKEAKVAAKKAEKAAQKEARARQEEISKAGAQKLPGDDFRRVLDSERANLTNRASQEHITSLAKGFMPEMIRFHKSIDSQASSFFMQKNNKQWEEANKKVQQKQREFKAASTVERRLALTREIRELGNQVADLSFQVNRIHLEKSLEKFEAEAKRVGATDQVFATNANKAALVTKKEIEFVEAMRTFQRKSRTTTSLDSFALVKEQFDSYKKILNELKEELTDTDIDLSKLETIKQELDKLNKDEELFRSALYDTALGIIAINVDIYRTRLQDPEASKETKGSLRNYIAVMLCQSDCAIEFINFYYRTQEGFVDNEERAKIQENFKKELEEEPGKFLDRVDEFIKQEAQAKTKCLSKEFESVDCNDANKTLTGFHKRAAAKFLSLENKSRLSEILGIIEDDQLITKIKDQNGIEVRQIKTGKELEVINALADSFLDEQKGTKLRHLKKEVQNWYQVESSPALNAIFRILTTDIFPRIYNSLGFFKAEVEDQLNNFETGIIDSENKQLINEINGTEIAPLEIIERTTILGKNSSAIAIGDRQRVVIDSEKLAMASSVKQKEAEVYLEDLEKDKINVFAKPQYLNEYFRAHEAYSVKDPQGKVDTVQFRQKQRDDLIARKAFAQTSSNYIDAINYKKSPNHPEIYWGLYQIEREDSAEALLKEGSCVRDLIEPLVKEHYDLYTDNVAYIRDQDWTNLTEEILRAEANLRAIAASKDPISLLNEALTGTIIPTKSTERPKTTRFENLSKILTTQALTQEILGEEITNTVNWNALVESDLVDLNKNFSSDWSQYQKNPEEFVKADKDPLGLMRLRSAWYKYIRDNMPNLEAIKTYAKSGKLQNAAKDSVARNFVSYQDRETLNPNWQKYYQKNLAI